jgi:hypothetical protein
MEPLGFLHTEPLCYLTKLPVIDNKTFFTLNSKKRQLLEHLLSIHHMDVINTIPQTFVSPNIKSQTFVSPKYQIDVCMCAACWVHHFLQN